jgi:hypothetical protein
MKNKQKVKSFHVETFDGGAYLNFFTEAKNHRQALKNLASKSLDLKNLSNMSENSEWIIKIKQLK